MPRITWTGVLGLVLKLEATLILAGLIGASAGVVFSLVALFTHGKNVKLISRQLLFFSLLCLIVQATIRC